jgi:hypothetical protein
MIYAKGNVHQSLNRETFEHESSKDGLWVRLSWT